MKKTTARVGVVALLLGVLLPGIAHSQAGGQGQAEEFARRQYDSGLTFYAARKYSEALKDFEAVVNSYSNSSVADDSLLAIAQYQLDIARDLSAAQSAVDALLKKYPTSDSAAMAHVIAGRIAFNRSHAAADLDTALASFERVPRLFPGTQAVPAAFHYSGVTLQLARRNAEALERYRSVLMQHPASIWAARAQLGSAIGLTVSGRPVQALEALQRVRTAFAGTEEATTAANLNTILYRLYVRAPAQPAYVFSGRGLGAETSKMREALAIGVNGGLIHVALENTVLVFDEKGAQVRSIGGADLSGIFFDYRGTPVILRPGTLLNGGNQPMALSIPESDGTPRALEELAAGVGTSLGHRLVSDRSRTGSIERFSETGGHMGPFATAIKVDRLAIDALDNVAALDASQKRITVFDRDGKQIGQLLQKGTGYVLEEPVDVAFDQFGHLYVLDRETGSVLIFNPQWKLITTFTIAEKSPGAFQRARALGIDPAGRLYIYNDRAQRVQIYR